MSFIGGASLDDDELHGLRQAVSELKFLRLVEQSVERCHAIGNLNMRRAPRHAEAYWSLALRGNELDKHISQDASFVADLGHSCDAVRNPQALPDQFRLSSHPLVMEAVESGAKYQKLTEVLRPLCIDATGSHSKHAMPASPAMWTMHAFVARQPFAPQACRQERSRWL